MRAYIVAVHIELPGPVWILADEVARKEERSFDRKTIQRFLYKWQSLVQFMRREIQVNDLLAGIGAVVSAFRFLQGALRGIGLRLRLAGAE